MNFLEKLNKNLLTSLFFSILVFAILAWIQSKGKNVGLIEPDSWRYVHIGDSNENIKNALFLAKGGKLNEYATSNHMPGVYLYLSLFFSLLPNDIFSNSTGNEVLLVSFSNFITIFTAISLVFFAINLVANNKFYNWLSKLLFLGILLDLYIRFDFYRILSETYLPWIQLTYLVLIYHYLKDKESRFSYLIAGFYFITISIFFGLTNVFTDFVFLAFSSFFIISNIKQLKTLSFVPGLLILLLLYFKSADLDFHYWIIVTNRAQGLGSGLQFLTHIANSAIHWPSNWYTPGGFGPIYDNQFYTIILGGIVLFLFRKERSIFFLTMISILVLPFDSWRYSEEGFIQASQSYKTDVNMGVCFFFILILVQQLPKNIETYFDSMKRRFHFDTNIPYTNLAISFIMLICAFRILSFLMDYAEIENKYRLDHSEWIKNQNLCKQNFIKTNPNCSCLVIMHWDQQFFIRNNVIPCNKQFSSYSPHLNFNDEYFHRIQSSFTENKAKFLLSHSDLYTNKTVLSPRLVDLFKSGQCDSVVDNLLFICKKGN
ncbi:hypothetical protein P3G55_14390 [Leptospira sp. 96542]|nr:hypothetical protein [Leptospira sp. 96542]